MTPLDAISVRPLHFLLQAAPDTVVTVLARDGLETAAAVALVVLGAFVLLLILALLLLVLQIRKIDRTVRGLGQQALEKAQPLIDGGREVTENVAFITDAVRTDVERLNASVKALTARLQQASDRMEERIEEFNALMEVVQSEAEDIFVGTASTVRGVRAGARSLGGRDAGADDSALDEAVHDEDEVFLTGAEVPPGDRAASPADEPV